MAKLMRVLWLVRATITLYNNRSERTLRTIVVGRKNWIFYGSDIHAQAAAVLFTMIAACRLHKLDPQQYLDETMRLIPQCPLCQRS